MSSSLNPFWKKHTPHVILLMVLISIAVAGWLLQSPEQPVPAKNSITNDGSEVKQQTSSVTVAHEGQENNTAVGTGGNTVQYTSLQPNESTIAATTSEPNQDPQLRAELPSISNTLVADGTTYTIEHISGRSVFDVMMLLQNQTDFSFATRDYGGQLGHFVTTIKEKKNEDEPGKYWIYSINEKKAQVGISNYILQPHDIITWTYEASEI